RLSGSGLTWETKTTRSASCNPARNRSDRRSPAGDRVQLSGSALRRAIVVEPPTTGPPPRAARPWEGEGAFRHPHTVLPSPNGGAKHRRGLGRTGSARSCCPENRNTRTPVGRVRALRVTLSGFEPEF